MPTRRSALLRPLAPALLLAATVAHAQMPPSASPYSTSVYNEGPGIRLGTSPLTLHPGVALEAGYDSNVFYLPSMEVGSALLRVRGHLDLATLPPQAFENDNSTADPKLDFRLSAQVEYREYLTSNASVQAQRSLNVGAGADLVILPRGPLTVNVGDLFVRTVDPRNEESPANYSRDFDRATLGVQYQLGALTFGLSDEFHFNLWETKEIQFGNSWGDEGRLFGKLRLLAQTFLTLVARFGVIRYDNNAAVNSTPLRVTAGGSSMFTSWFGASASIGYGNSFNAMGRSFSSVIGSADIRFLLPRRVRLTLSYDRDFSDSILANFYADDHVFLGFDMPLIWKFTAHLDGGVRFRQYGTLIDPMKLGATGYCNAGTCSSDPTATQRNDVIYDGRAEIGLRVTDWLAVAANYNLFGDATDFAILIGASQSRVSYIKHSAFFRVDVAY